MTLWCIKIAASLSVCNTEGYNVMMFLSFYRDIRQMHYNLLPWNSEGQWGKWTKNLLSPIRHTCLPRTVNTTHYLHPLKVPLLRLLHSSVRSVMYLCSLQPQSPIASRQRTLTRTLVIDDFSSTFSFLDHYSQPSFFPAILAWNSSFSPSLLPFSLPLFSPFLTPALLNSLPSLPLFLLSFCIQWVWIKLTIWQALC